MNTKRIAAAFAGAALVVIGSAGGSYADYAEPTIDLTVTPTILPGGESFTGTATSNQNCNWSITYAGPSSTTQPILGTGTSINFEFSTNPVEAQQTDPVKAVCNYDDGLRVGAIQSPSRSVDVTLTSDAIVSPPIVGGGGIGGLPNTGGPSIWLAALGAALTAIGAGAVIRSRRPARA